MYVYLITNTINGKRYVGQTRQTLTHRWNGHTHRSGCTYLYNAIQKYGKENFIIEPIVEVPTQELANEFEIEYINRYCTLYPNGYNIMPGGNKISEETIKKLSDANKRKTLSEEHKQRIAEALKGNKNGQGRVVTEEQRQRLSAIHTGRFISDEWRRKLSESHKGKQPRLGTKASEESRRRMSASQRARPPLSEEIKKKMALSQQTRRAREAAARNNPITQ